jgi:hypothetical protein
MACGEVSGLNREDVDLRHDRELGSPKARAARRTIELNPEMIRNSRALRRLLPVSGWPAFPNLDDRRSSPRMFWERWPRDRERIDRTYGLLDPTLSDARKTCPPRRTISGVPTPKWPLAAEKRP